MPRAARADILGRFTAHRQGTSRMVARFAPPRAPGRADPGPCATIEPSSVSGDPAMQNKKSRPAVALALALSLAYLGSSPAHAHHSFAAQYDAAKPITLTGKVTKVEWTNP